MAMTRCRECRQPVSSQAKTCPHCGIGKAAVPVRAPGLLRSVWFWLLVTVLFAFFCITRSANQTSEANERLQEATLRSIRATQGYR